MQDQDASHASSEKRRRRPPLACIDCRRRKGPVELPFMPSSSLTAHLQLVRCDRKMPCQNCMRARRATTCAYVPDDRTEPRDGTHAFHDGINGRSADKDDVISMPFPTLRPTSSTRSTSGADADPSPAALAERIRQLEQRLARVKGVSRPSSQASNRPETAVKDASSAPVMMAKNRYFGSSHWLHGVILVSLLFIGPLPKTLGRTLTNHSSLGLAS